MSYKRHIKNENIYETHNDYTILKIHSPTHGDFDIFLDTDDIEKVKLYHWHITRIVHLNSDFIVYYAITSSSGMKGALLQRFLCDFPNKLVVDHIDGNTLNNRKDNLRICTREENNMNRKKYANNTSGHRGVNYVGDKYINKWLANIRVNSILMCLGYFFTYEEAVKVREKAEKEYYGEFSRNID